MLRILTTIFLLLAPAASAEPQLLMIEQDGCHWCERWHEEIGPIYPKTTEGKAAPLRRLDIHQPMPDGLALSRSAVYTPTFVLVVDGQEVGRLEGYAGDEFFWVLLDEMMEGAGLELTPAG